MELQISHFRDKQEITQSDLAKQLNVSPKSIWNWESGKTFPNAQQLWSCACALHCTPNDLLGWYDEHPQDNVTLSSFEKQLVSCFRESTKEQQGALLIAAHNAADVSKDTAKRLDIQTKISVNDQ